MTTQKNDQAEEAAFDDFLEGRGELVKQLKKLAQLTPSAALDAAILASAKAAVAQAERSKLTAANDAVAPAMSAKPGFLSNFRMPMGLAASLMVAVIVSVMWHQSTDLSVELSQASDAAPVTAEVAVAPLATPPIAVQVDALAKAKIPVTASKPAAVAAAPVQAAPVVPTTTVAVAKPVAPAVPAPVAVVKPPVLVAPVAPPVAAATPVVETKSVMSDKKADMSSAVAGAANDVSKRSPERVESAATGTTATVAVTAPVAAPAIVGNQTKETTMQAASVATPAAASVSTPAAASVSTPAAAAESAKPEVPLTAVEKAKAWLVAIEEMSKYESRQEAALVQLERFEKSYPHYPVPDALRAKLKK